MANNEHLRDNSPERVFSRSLNVLGKSEAEVVSRLLLHPRQRISRDDVLGAVLSSGANKYPEEFGERFRHIEETVGWPSEDDTEIVYDVLTPREILETMEKGTFVTKFNNWFTRFVYAPGKIPGDECLSFFTGAAAQTCPAKYRLRVLCPKLTEKMEEYGTTHVGSNEFYGGLSQDPTMLELFTITDQLLQRLVRPGDEAYEQRCTDLISGTGKGDYTAPSYDELTVDGPRVVHDARMHLLR